MALFVVGSNGPRPALIALLVAVAEAATAAKAQAPSAVVVTNDAITAPLDDRVGNAAEGRRVVLDRETGNCLICHQVPEPGEAFQGEIGPDLRGVGSRLDTAQIRLRVVDMARINPSTVMPPYFRTDGLTRVMPKYKGKPVLGAQEVEDVVAYLASLVD